MRREIEKKENRRKENGEKENEKYFYFLLDWREKREERKCNNLNAFFF